MKLVKINSLSIRLIVVVIVGILSVAGCGGKKKKAALWPLALLGTGSAAVNTGSAAVNTGSAAVNTGSATGNSDTGTVANTEVDTNFLNFDKAGVNYTITSFGGSVSTKEVGPAGGNGMAVKVVKGTAGAPAELWAGTIASTGSNESIEPIPLSATSNIVTVLIHSPTIGTRIRLKFDDATDPTHCVETDTFTTAVGWQTLTFDFTNHATGTQALNPAYTFNRVIIFMDFGNTGNTGQIFYFDDFKFPVK